MGKRKLVVDEEEDSEPQERGLQLLKSLKRQNSEKRLIVVLTNASLETVKVS